MTFGPHRLESALARVQALADTNARDAAREAVTAVLDLHGEGLRRLAMRLREVAADGDGILRTVAEDEVVGSVLALHGAHPLSLQSRVQRALAGLDTTEHGGDGRVDVISVDVAAIRLRVSGSARFRSSVARAVEDAAPDAERVEVIGSDLDLIPIGRLVRTSRASHERCDLCSAELAADHGHLFDVERRRLTCACAACGVLFASTGTNLRPVHRSVMRLRDFRMTESQWEALNVPVRLAFFSRSSSLAAVVVAYPGPAGAIESMVPAAAWDVLVQENTTLASLECDTSALLIHRAPATPRHYMVSIDECYRLTGLVRSRWQGLTGGDGATQAIEEFFGSLEEMRA